METKVYVEDRISKSWKELAMKRFGYGRGSISKAAQEALVLWIRNEEKITLSLRRLKDVATNEEDVDSILLFGSYARCEPYNDVDVAVIVSANSSRINVLSKLENILPDAPRFDLSVFNDMPLSLKSRVLSECRVIYSREGFDLKGLSADIMQHWIDIKPMLDSVLV